MTMTMMCLVNVHKYKIITIDAMDENDDCRRQQQQHAATKIITFGDGGVHTNFYFRAHFIQKA